MTEPVKIPDAENPAVVSFVASRLNAELARGEYPCEFTERAISALFRAQSNFVADVGVEAIRLARLSRNDAVNEVNVDAAIARLRGSTERGAQGWLLGVGAAAIGVGITVLVTVLTAVDNPTSTWWFASFVPLLVGTAMLTYTAPRR